MKSYLYINLDIQFIIIIFNNKFIISYYRISGENLLSKKVKKDCKENFVKNSFPGNFFERRIDLNRNHDEYFSKNTTCLRTQYCK